MVSWAFLSSAAASPPAAIAPKAFFSAVSSAPDHSGEFGMNQVAPSAASPVALFAGSACL